MLIPYKERYTWFRTPSLEITNDQIPDESLDAGAARKALQSVRKDDIVSRLADISGQSQSELSKLRKADIVA
mgnify:CR=1 FL=1